MGVANWEHESYQEWLDELEKQKLDEYWDRWIEENFLKEVL
jgi:hypothetical protein